MVFKRFPLFILVLFNIFKAISQENTFPFHHIEFINSAQGLNGNEVDCIMQDKKGFMWIMTGNGLNRYDGFNFRFWTYRPDDVNTLVQGTYYEVAEGKNGTLWIQNELKGLYSFDPDHEKFKHYRNLPDNPNSLIDDNTWAIAAESNGNIWIGTSTGLDKYNPGTTVFTHFMHHADDSTSLRGDTIFKILFDDTNSIIGNHNNLWLINNKIGIDHFDPKTGKVLKHFDFPFRNSGYPWGGNPVLSIAGIKNNVFWIGSNDEGIYGFDTNTEQFIHIRMDRACKSSYHINGFYSVWEDYAGNLWTVNDNNEIVYFDQILQKYFFYPVDRTKADFFYWPPMIFEDKSHKLFIGTNNGLLTVHIHQKPFFTYRPNTIIHFFISENLITDRYRLNQNPSSICFSIIHLFCDSKTNLLPAFPLTINGKSYSPETIYKDRKGALWFTGFPFGIISYDPVTKKNRQYQINDNPNSLKFTTFTQIIEDQKGRIWARSRSDGLYKIDIIHGIAHKVILPKEINVKTINQLEFIFIDSRGMLYLSSREGGLVTYNPDHEIFTIYHHNANDPTTVSSETLTVFLEAKNGLIWFGTIGGGINVFNPVTAKFKAFSIKEGFPHFDIRSLTEDKNGDYWVGTRSGISCFTPPDNPFAEDCRIRFRNYDVMDGLPSNNCSFNSAFCDPGGTMYFGTLGGGMFYFHPDSLKDNPFLPPVQIVDFKLFNKKVTTNDSTGLLHSSIENTAEIKLTHKQNVFSFTFVALNYIHPEKNKYAYKLDGFNDEWIYTDADNRTANYTNLNAGTYLFRVRGSNNDGIWNPKEATIKLIITPPYWQTWWFRALIVAAVASILYSMYWYRLQQVIKLQSIRNKIAGDLHDDIGSTLNSISIYSEVARKKNEHQDEALEMIGDASRKIIEAMSDIVWTINPDNDSFAKIIFRMKSLAYNVFRAKKIEFTFHADEILNEKKLSLEARRNFYLIFKEAINNLVKYSNATQAVILLSNENNYIRLRIQDDGVGFDISQDNPGNGLKNMKRRADEMKADFKIISSVGNGTQIELILKA